MSWLVASIDEERGEPGRRLVKRALERPSVPRPPRVSTVSGPPCEIGFAHSLRDEARSSGPFVDEARGLHLVADLRLDNRGELQDGLGLGPSASDLALVAAAWARFGSDLPSRLVGAFALVIWDARSRTLFAARDAMGERPLFYRAEGARLVFASRVEQLLSVERALPAIEDETVFGFLFDDYSRIDRTFFRGIHRLPPGHFLLRRGSGEARIRRYFHPPETFSRLPHRDDYDARFREILRDAVVARLDSSAPIVAHLSGGLDSSSIACLADQLYRQGDATRPPLRLVSGLYPGLDCDESRFIREITAKVALPWEGYDATSLDFRDLEQPYLDWPGGRSSKAGFAGDLAIAEREGAGVLLSGFGGDDVGSEVGIFRDLVRLGRFRELLRETLLSRDFHWGPRPRVLLDSLKGLLPQQVHEVYRRHRPRKALPAPTWLGPRLRPLWPGPRPEVIETPRPFLSHTQRWLFHAFTNPHRAFCADLDGRQVEEVGAEVRYPFFDSRLASFVMRIPPEHRLPGGSYRVLQRRSMRGIVPDAILDRHEATTFEAAFLKRARMGLSRYLAFIEEGGEFLSGAYVDKAGMSRLVAQAKGIDEAGGSLEVFRTLENIAHLEAWLRALRAYRARDW